MIDYIEKTLKQDIENVLVLASFFKNDQNQTS